MIFRWNLEAIVPAKFPEMPTAGVKEPISRTGARPAPAFGPALAGCVPRTGGQRPLAQDLQFANYRLAATLPARARSSAG